MIRLSVLYPATEGATFDHDYYRDQHVPLYVSTWGLDGDETDKGVDGPYEAALHLRFESVEAMEAAMTAERTKAVPADVPNNTTIRPVMQGPDRGRCVLRRSDWDG